MTQVNLSRILALTTLGTALTLSSCTGAKPVAAPVTSSGASSQDAPSSTTLRTEKEPQTATPSVGYNLDIEKQSSSKPGDKNASQQPQAPAADEPTRCLTFSFRHQATPSHQPSPDCIEHQNRIALPEPLLTGSFDLNQLCIRVDGVAVQSVRNGNQLILAGTPRSNSVISVRGCPKVSQCKSDCQIVRDAVMDDLIGESDIDSEGYDAEAAKKLQQAMSADLKRELAQLDEDEINSNWVLSEGPELTQAQACNRKLSKK